MGGLVNVPRLGTNCGHIYHILFGFPQYSESILNFKHHYFRGRHQNKLTIVIVFQTEFTCMRKII